MKSQYLFPAATAVIGFSIAWLAKPAEDSNQAPAADGPPVATAPTRPVRPSAERPKSSDSDRETVKASNLSLAEQFEKGPKSREEAKMLRLAEALGLSVDQQGSIISLIERVQATANDQISVIEDMAIRGKAIEDGLREILTPEQFAKFQELRERERENRSEVRAQLDFKNALEDIDMSAEQRAEILDRLRLKSKEDLQSIPAAATLLLDKSMLPTGNKELSVDGVLLLSQIGSENIPMDPAAAQRAVAERQRAEIERILQCFDGILTPAQMGQYQAALAEQKELMERLHRDASRGKQIPFAGEEDVPNNDLENE